MKKRFLVTSLFLCALLSGCTPTNGTSSSSSVLTSSSLSSDAYPQHLHWLYDLKSYKNGSYTNYLDYADYVACRLPVNDCSTLSEAPLYELAQDFGSGDYTKQQVCTLLKDEIYSDPGEVASYYQAFKCFPKNYFLYSNKEKDSYSKNAPYSSSDAAKEAAYKAYGSNGRIYTSYCRQSGYIDYLPSFNGVSYYEADIDDGSGNYGESGSSSRGGGRLVVLIGGVKDYNGDSAIYRSNDHYYHFKEFANFYNGWGVNFNGEGGTLFQSRVNLNTISL